jgi:hypothetical protein
MPSVTKNPRAPAPLVLVSAVLGDVYACFGFPLAASIGRVLTQEAVHMKKLILSIVVVFVLLMGTNYLIHAVWLMPDYDAIPASHRSLAGIMHRFWAMAVGQFFFAVVFAYIYAQGVQPKPSLAQGIRYGVIITLFTVIPFSLSQYDTYVVPYLLAIKWIIAGGIQMVLLGIIVAAIYKDAQT